LICHSAITGSSPALRGSPFRAGARAAAGVAASVWATTGAVVALNSYLVQQYRPGTMASGVLDRIL
jgi:hypothetical protein